MARAEPRFFTIPSGIPFARALAHGIVAESGGDPFALADALVLVPTRRAARGLRDAFAEVRKGAVLLPRIRGLGDIDENDDAGAAESDLALPPAIAPLRRQILLATLVRRWGEARGTTLPFTLDFHSAGELARFFDEATTQGVDLKTLKDLAPATLAAHWQDVVGFLNIVAEHWPPLLAAEGAMEPAARRDAQLRALADSLAALPPSTPVIAAGSTGSIPATAELLKTIALLPTGYVVLPGLDTDLDDKSWEELTPAHPQYGLKALLAYSGVDRDSVRVWPHFQESFAARPVRVRFLSEALRPPPTTDAWRDLVEHRGGELGTALNGVSLIEAANPREEALVAAIALRETLETTGRTAALVTPDRGLARRVAAELNRWDIAIDDSAGLALSRTPPGAFLAALARAAAENFSPVSLLALLKHPWAAGGEERAEFLRRVRGLEIGALRGLKPQPGLAGIAARLARDKHASDALRQWFANLTRLLMPLAEAMQASDAVLGNLARVHSETAEALTANDRKAGAETLWRGPAGEAAANLIEELIRDGGGIALGRGRHYGELFRDIAETRAVRPPYNRHPRVAILGPLEARLLDFDLIVLAGLNEGGWPAGTATDPWLSRPMRLKLGLEAPERRVGLAAHDFATLASSGDVLLTRSLKENGTPSVPSRWLLRIRKLAKGLGIEDDLSGRNHLLHWARAIDDAPRQKRAARPAPRPPVAARPRELSITQIETWLRDPYAIYARNVLKLKPLDPLETEPGPQQRGIAVHGALERFLLAFPDALPGDAMEQLLRFGDEAFAEAGASSAILALWRPRFRRAASWFLEYERTRRKDLARSAVEVTGHIVLPTDPPFKLNGRADRIDIFDDGSAAILDYKTGRVPSDKQIDLLIAPQLPLEAAMLMHGGFAEFTAKSIRAFIHVQLSGGERAGNDYVAKGDAGAKAMEALERLTARVMRYDNETQPYRSREMPFRLTDVGDYDHLARVKEWTRDGGGEE